MKNKILTVILVLTMGLCLAGCNKSEGNLATTPEDVAEENVNEEAAEEFVSSGLYDNYDIKGTLLYGNGSWVFVARERDTREEKTFLYHIADKKLVEFTAPEMPICDVSGYSIVYCDPDVTQMGMEFLRSESSRYEVMNVETGEVYLDEVGLITDMDGNFYRGDRLGVYTCVDVEGTDTFGIINNAGEWVYEMKAEYPFLADDCEWDGFTYTYIDEHGEYVYWYTRGTGNTFYNMENGSMFNMNEKAGENVNYCWRTEDDFYVFSCNSSGAGGYYLKYNCVQDACEPVTEYAEYISTSEDGNCKMLFPENFAESLEYGVWYTDIDECGTLSMELMRDKFKGLMTLKGGIPDEVIVEFVNAAGDMTCYYHISDGGAEVSDVRDLFYMKDAYYFDNIVVISDEETGWIVYDLSTKEITEYPDFIADIKIADAENNIIIASSDGVQYMIYVDDITNWIVPL